MDEALFSSAACPRSFIYSFLDSDKSRDLHMVGTFMPTVFGAYSGRINNTETITLRGSYLCSHSHMEHLSLIHIRGPLQACFQQFTEQQMVGELERVWICLMRIDKAWYPLPAALWRGWPCHQSWRNNIQDSLKVGESRHPVAFNDIPLLSEDLTVSHRSDMTQVQRHNADLQLTERENKDERIDEPGFYNGIAKLNELLNDYNSRLKVLRKEERRRKR